MKISYQWLKTYLPALAESPEQIGQRLLLAGFPVESIEAAGDDFVIDVEVTSNRPDLLGHIGMAREVSALTGVPLVLPKVSPAGDATPALAAKTSVKLQSPDCPLYTARIIEGVKIRPSPAWLVKRVETLGLRPVNNVVDITNFVLFEYSQPLHAFDYDKLAERRIVVRKAARGEKITSIDGHVRELDPSMLVIADAARPVAVAGVMGGLDSEVGPTTKTILLESAYFDPMSIRATARKLGLFSDSSFRFERGVDLSGVTEASNRATDLIVELCGGKAMPGFAVDPANTERPAQTPTVSMRIARLEKLLGSSVPATRVVEILAALQLSPKLSSDKAQVTVTVPSFRQDLRREVDLIEEVARVHGYDKIPVRDTIELVVRPPNFRQNTMRRIARALTGLGFFETVSITFVLRDRAELFARGGPGRLEVDHSSRKAENALRRSLLPSLLAARRHNETVQVKRADLFEIAAVFDPRSTGILPVNSSGAGTAPKDMGGTPMLLPIETLRLGLTADSDMREARGVLEQLVRQLDPRAELTLRLADRPEFVPGQGAEVLVNGQVVGLVGRVADAVRAQFELHQEVTVAEVDVEPLLALASRQHEYCPLARFPAIDRDLSILVDEPVTWQQVQQTIREAAPAELESIEFADLFRGGKQFPPGKKSFTFTLRYRLAEGTLTNEQANAFAEQSVKALSAKLGAALRDK
ncbi:MAG: phenylalanine--tRNA ligase subunit beta [Phycisphaerae bacterium]|nr:phenylalanine--tRNA ligase subunit beta [Phycisphaerae bacterium]